MLEYYQNMKSSLLFLIKVFFFLILAIKDVNFFMNGSKYNSKFTIKAAQKVTTINHRSNHQ